VLKIKHALIAALAIPALALGAVACDDSDDAESNSNASQEEVETLAARVQRNEMMFYTSAIRDAQLHAMDEDLNATGVIESSYIPNTRGAVRLIALTDWPDEFQADADALEAVAIELLHALEDDDAETAGPLATELHEAEHDFNAEVTNELVKDLPPDAGGPEEHDDGGSTTPEAGATEEGDHSESESPEAEATP
jgi:hypothetical protein